MQEIEIYIEDSGRGEEITFFLENWGNKDEFIVCKTSGSTGTPKNIEITKNKMQISARKTIDYFNIKKGNSALLCLSLETIAGKMMLVRSLIGELKLDVSAVSVNPILTLKNPVDFVALVPMQLEAAVDTAVEKLKSIKIVLVGGAPVSEGLIQKLKDHKITVFQSYGMTETISHVAIRKIGFITEKYYTALDGISFSSQNECLVIDYPEILDEQLLTNDRVKLKDSKHFQYINRYDFIINTGGIKVNPEEIEIKIATLLNQPYFIWFLQDAQLGQKIVLIIQTIATFPLQKELFKTYLQKHEIPKNYALIKNFFHTKSGKIDRITTMETIEENQWQILN